MDMKCIEHRKKQPDMEEFKRVMKPAVEWLQKNGCPHDSVIIKSGSAELVSMEIGFTVGILD